MSDHVAVYAELEKHLVAMQTDPQSLRESLGQIDRILKEHRSELPAKLAHYLERRSYGKALEFVRA